MKPEEISTHLENLKARLAELEQEMADPSFYSDQANCRKVSREHQKLTGLFQNHDRWVKALTELEENRLLAEEEEDEEMKAMAEMEIEKLSNESEQLEKVVQVALLPPDPNESRNIIVEIKPAAGGEEAALFAGDLYRAYLHYADKRGWKYEILDQNESELGGIRDAVFSLAGDDVFNRLKYESGVHRVQRIPTTESGGRIHTSTITVAVLPEAEDVDLEIRQEDLRIDVFRASGPGGQSVNTTDSAVRITHLPSGLIVTSQQEKSQHRNKDLAMRVLRARLLEVKQAEEAAKQAADKRSQVGTGDRSERIRTYNYPQNRVTDHRYNVSMHNLPKLMEGEFDMILEDIMVADAQQRLEALSDDS